MTVRQATDGLLFPEGPACARCLSLDEPKLPPEV
jgi:hypothetical protein